MLRSRRQFSEVAGVVPAVSWGAVFSGAVVGLALLATLSVLWFAIAGSFAGFATALPWIEALTAVLALFAAGYLAGWMSAAPGISTGLANGLTVWGLFAIAVTAVGAPAVTRVTGFALTPAGVQPTVTVSDAALWATFWSLLVGVVAACVGGLVGGAVHGRSATSGVIAEDTIVDDNAPYHAGSVDRRPATDATVVDHDEGYREPGAPTAAEIPRRRRLMGSRR